MRAFLRSHGNQVDLDVLTLRGLGELLHRPLQPALLLSSVGNADLGIGRAAENSTTGTAAQLRYLRLSCKQVIRPCKTRGDKQEHHHFAQARQFWFICHGPSAYPCFKKMSRYL